MATNLRSNDTIQVRIPQGGGSVRDVPLSELNEYISTEEAAGITTLATYVGDYSAPKGTDIATDLGTLWDDIYPKSEPDGRSLQEQSEAAYVATTQQGVAAKLSAIATGADDVGEMLQSKYILYPVLNESIGAHKRADNTFEYVDASGVGTGKLTTIRMREYGTGGNAWSIITTDSVEADVLDIDTGTQTITLKEGSTGAELLEAIAADSDALSLFIWDHSGGQDDYFIPEITVSFFTGGLSGHVLTSTGTQIDAVVAQAPTTGAPITAQVAAKATYGTDKITFTADAVGADGNAIDVVATCQLSATLGSGTTEITLVGEAGLYCESTPPLVSVQITQAAAEAPFSVTNTAGVIVCELPADADNIPINLTMANLVAGIEAEMTASGELEGVIVEVEVGGSFDPAAVATTTAAVPFTAADNTVVEIDDTVTIWLANNGTNFDDWSDVVTEVNNHANNTLVTASAGAESEAEPFEAISLTGGVDITAGAPGAIRYEANKIWISVAESTANESNWKYAALS